MEYFICKNIVLCTLFFFTIIIIRIVCISFMINFGNSALKSQAVQSISDCVISFVWNQFSDFGPALSVHSVSPKQAGVFSICPSVLSIVSGSCNLKLVSPSFNHQHRLILAGNTLYDIGHYFYQRASSSFQLTSSFRRVPQSGG
jgi:hypothetical protein